MTLDNVNRWLTLVANLGVLAGIAFLIIEVNQNTQATTAAARDATVGHTLNFFEQSMDSKTIAYADFKIKSGAELDGYERAQLRRYQYYNFRVFENIYTQYEQGLFTDHEWSRFRSIINEVLDDNEIALDMWNDKQDHWTEGFKTEINGLISEDLTVPTASGPKPPDK